MVAGGASNVEERVGSLRYHPLVLVLAAVCAGIVVDRDVGLPFWFWWSGALIAGAGWWVLWRRNWLRSASVTLLVSVASLAGVWHHGQWYLYSVDDLSHFARPAAEPTCVEAVATESPQRIPAPPRDPFRAIPQNDRSQLQLEILAVRDRDAWQPASGRVRLMVDGHLLGVHSGDRLRVFAQLSASTPPDNPGEFDYAAYERIERRRCRLWAEFPDGVTVLAAGGRWRPMGWLESVRAAGNRLLERHLSSKSYGLAAALLLGLREELSREGTDAFLETGTVHVLSISGLHVGIIAATISLLLRPLLIPQGRKLLVTAVLTTLYTILTGAQPPAVRSLVLVLILCLSNYRYRPGLPLNSLAAAGLVVLAYSPAHLFNIGVQLSFLAVVGLIYYRPSWFGETVEASGLERLVRQSQGWLSWAWDALWRTARQATMLSLVVWSLTLPLVMARFHLLQPAALVLNTFLCLLVPIALVSGFGVVIFGWLIPPVGALCGWICSLSSGLLQWLTETIREVPGSHFWVPGPADWWLAGFYGGLLVMALFPRLRPPRRWCLAVFAGWVALGFGGHFLHQPRQTLQATFLSVGHGCAVVIELPNGTTMLYDAGSFSSPQVGIEAISACLWSKGLLHLDAVVLSHADSDHYNALAGLLRRFSVGVVYVSPVMFQRGEDRALSALHQSIEEAGVPLRPISAGDRLLGGQGCQIEVLNPPRRGLLGGDNANSLVVAIEYLGRRILLPGDLASPGLEDVMAEEPWDCDVLLAPHHGSRQSDPPGLARWCRPEWVVISGGHRNDSAETIVQYRRAGSRILQTGTMGAVWVSINPRGLMTQAGPEVKGKGGMEKMGKR
jgi:competence protein ComEC